LASARSRPSTSKVSTAIRPAGTSQRANDQLYVPGARDQESKIRPRQYDWRGSHMQKPAVTYMSENDLLQQVERLSNEGRWGAEDELGTLNFISAAKRVEAARLVRQGRSVSIAKDLVSPLASQAVPSVVH